MCVIPPLLSLLPDHFWFTVVQYMHADIAQSLHSSQGRFSLILHASPSIFSNSRLDCIIVFPVFVSAHSWSIHAIWGCVLAYVYWSGIPPLQCTIRESYKDHNQAFPRRFHVSPRQNNRRCCSFVSFLDLPDVTWCSSAPLRSKPVIVAVQMTACLAHT